MKNPIGLRRMARLAILIAMMLIFAFTPLGYLKLGPVEITFMVLPVAVGAVLLGPAAGAALGAVFGLTSFFQCFGTSAFGVLIFGISPWKAFVCCVAPRVLCGWLPGLLFQAMTRKKKAGILSFLAACLSCALLNTVLFTGMITLCYLNDPVFSGGMAGFGVSAQTFWLFAIGFVGLNGLVEAGVCSAVGAVIARILHTIDGRRGTRSV